MKKILWLLLARRNAMDPRAKKKILITLSIFAAFTFVLFGFVAYGVFKFSSSVVSQISQNAPAIQKNLNEFATQVPSTLPAVDLQKPLMHPGCLSVVQSLMNIETWVAVPIGKTWNLLSQECFGAEQNIEQPAEKSNEDYSI